MSSCWSFSIFGSCECSIQDSASKISSLLFQRLHGVFLVMMIVENIVDVTVVVKNIAVVMIVVKKIVVAYFWIRVTLKAVLLILMIRQLIQMIYKSDFNLEYFYNILKDHPGWTDVEMPYFYQIHGRKKSKTSETTSGSASGGINLNEKVDEVVQETQEFRSMGRDRVKVKKKTPGSSSGGSSSFVDLVADKFYNIKQKKREKKDKEHQSYIDLKNRELSIQEAKAREMHS
uniref:Uncharacterized protein n=1 Tax=Tanacetum cinerariifolium TaxID=118510 RepID=A0A699JVU0_TANCI|nr:hypothetical protein [Tanacetum cinerariifolium]